MLLLEEKPNCNLIQEVATKGSGTVLRALCVGEERALCCTHSTTRKNPNLCCA